MTAERSPDEQEQPASAPLAFPATPDIDPALAAEMERRHKIAMRLQAAARAVRKDDPETAALRAEAAGLARSGVKEPFRRGRWGTMVNYECTMLEIDGQECPHAVLSEEGAWLHYTGRHLHDQNQGVDDDELLDDDDELLDDEED